MTVFFLKGLVIGFSIAAPVGPIGVLCIQRTLAHGRLVGFASGLGAATADAAYGSIAAFGLTFISAFLIDRQIWLTLIGGAFLIWLGWRTFTAAPAETVARADNNDDGCDSGGTSGRERGARIASAYGSTVLLTLTNPATILSSVTIFAGLGIGKSGSEGANYGLAAVLVSGVFIGSALWWLILSGITGAFRDKTQRRHLVWVNRGSGLLIGGFGAVALASLWIST